MMTYKRIKYGLLLPLLLMVSLSSMAQSFLSLDSAIAITMKKNYNILISQNTYQQASNSYAPGMAGMLPTINLNAGYNASNTDISQKYSSGLEINKNGAASSTISPGVGLTWTLFDGTKMFIAYNQLGLFRDEGMINMKATMQDNIASVIEAYYNVVQQNEILAVIDSDMALYKQEMDIAKEKFTIGSGSKLDYLQAEVNYNAEHSNYLKQEVNVTNSIATLNQLLELPVVTTYSVSDSIVQGKALVYDSLKRNMLAQNPTLELAKTNMTIAHNSSREINAMRLPNLNLALNYGLTHTQSNAGFSLYNQSLGFSGGLTFTWTLFNGMSVNIQHENAVIGELNAKFQYNEAEMQESTALFEAFKQYDIYMKIQDMDEENLLVAKEDVTVAMAQFRIGTSNIIQLQQAQTSYVTAESQVITDKYNTKVSETQLLLLAGQLVK